MNQLQNIPYDKTFLADDSFLFKESNQIIYLQKTYCNFNGLDHYFLKLYDKKTGYDYELLGYIYFYLNFEKSESKFIGIYVKDEYRNKGFASLLTSSWIKLCLDNGINNLLTNKRQRKPALLYLLKKYSFEIEKPERYKILGYTINICNKLSDNSKYLLFKTEKYKKSFISSSIIKKGDYNILESITDEFQIVDQVLLSNLYFIQDKNKAYQKSLSSIKKGHFN